MAQHCYKCGHELEIGPDGPYCMKCREYAPKIPKGAVTWNNPFASGKKPYKICTNTGCKFQPGVGNIHDPACPDFPR